jgi:hypothetical protein
MDIDGVFCTKSLKNVLLDELADRSFVLRESSAIGCGEGSNF